MVLSLICILITILTLVIVCCYFNIYWLLQTIANDIKDIRSKANNSQSMPLSKDKPVPREGFTLNEGLWPNKRR